MGKVYHPRATSHETVLACHGIARANLGWIGRGCGWEEALLRPAMVEYEMDKSALAGKCVIEYMFILAPELGLEVGFN